MDNTCRLFAYNSNDSLSLPVKHLQTNPSFKNYMLYI